MHFLKTLGILGLFARGSGFCVSILGLFSPLKEREYGTNVKYWVIENYLVAGMECGSARTRFYVVGEVRRSWDLPARSLSTWGVISNRHKNEVFFLPFLSFLSIMEQ